MWWEPCVKTGKGKAGKMQQGRMNRLFNKRRTLAWLAGLLVAPASRAQRATEAAAPAAQFAPVVPGYVLRFPQDEGSHPEFRTEWWYVTGWLHNAAGPLGFQITFFRTRPAARDDNPSAFAPRQLLIAHAAISDPALGKLQHDQHAARAGFSLAGAGQGRVEVWIDDWSLQQKNGAYHARIPARDFQLDLVLTATQPPLLQGVGGLSRKGPRAESASYYYSLPHLKAQGTLTRGGKAADVAGTAWFDHEWSSSYMDKEATGWDWVGINLADGGALMAFRMRNKQDGRLWAGGAIRDRHGNSRSLAPDEVIFTPRRKWRSPRSGATYPVSWRVRAGTLDIEIEPMMDDQENDARLSTGTVYWEGAVSAVQQGRPLGWGYLELTGYWRPLNF
jgi:predicted secreted hydrolase